jgi:hypothetical protein
LAGAAQTILEDIKALFKHSLTSSPLLSSVGLIFRVFLWFLPEESIEHVSNDSFE